MYPSEENERRNRWQDEYEASTREHQWANDSNYVSSPVWDDDSDIPAEVKQAFEE